MPDSPIAGKALLAVVSVICIATSRAPPVAPPTVPMWSIASQPLTLPCGTAEVWVAKSGKTGLGITVRVAPASRCVATVTASWHLVRANNVPARAFAGRLVVQRAGGDPEPHAHVPDPVPLDASYTYLAFELDNEDRWNRGQRTATLELSIEAGGKTQTWSLPATHAYRDWPKP